jgi:hypothetical protein
MDDNILINQVKDGMSDFINSFGQTLAPATMVPTTTDLSAPDDIFGTPYIDGDGMIHAIVSILSNQNEFTTVSCCERLVKKIVETFKFEATHENYQDLPIIEFVDNLFESLDNCSLTQEQIISKEQLKTSIIEGVSPVMSEFISEEMSPMFSPNPYSIWNECPFTVDARKVARGLNVLGNAVTDNEICESLIKIATLESMIDSRYEMTMENVITKKARDLSRKTNEVSAKVINKAGGTASELKSAGKHAVTPMEKFITDSMKKVKESDKNERRNVIIKGGFVPKVWRWVKRGITVIAGGTIGAAFPPVAVATGITFIGWIASDAFLDARERNKILRELEDEIEVVNEKIDDSRGDENKQKKYELIRIRSELNRTRDKIRLGLKY